ncbi:hypothetical protein PIB30_068499, partial [Stylosanthes scabra]|nr:hypothetical protein [Stylosanthes scabra]
MLPTRLDPTYAGPRLDPLDRTTRVFIRPGKSTRASTGPVSQIRASTRPVSAAAPLHVIANSSLPCQSEIATCHSV